MSSASNHTTAQTSSSTEISDSLALKQDVSGMSAYTTDVELAAYTYDKETIDEKIGQGGTFDPTMYYTTAQTSSSTEIGAALNEVSGDLDDINDILSGKADSSSVYAKNQTSSSTEIGDAFTAVNTALGGKANVSDVYTKSETSSSTEIEDALEGKVGVSEFEEIVGEGFTGATITDVILENEEIVAAAMTELNNRMDEHEQNSSVHVTPAEKARWDAGMETSAFTAHTANTVIHVSQTDRDNWNAKANVAYVNNAINTAVSNKVDADEFDDIVGSGFTGSDITSVITSNERVIAAAFAELNQKIINLESRVTELENRLNAQD